MSDLIEPFVKAGAALVGVAAAVWWIHYIGAKRASTEAALRASNEVLGKLQRARKARERIRGMSRRDRIDRL